MCSDWDFFQDGHSDKNPIALNAYYARIQFDEEIVLNRTYFSTIVCLNRIVVVRNRKRGSLLEPALILRCGIVSALKV